MLPTFVTNLFWGASDTDHESQQREVSEVDGTHTTVEHSIQEEAEDWLLIDTVQRSSDSTSDNCPDVGENDSVLSDGSWVITPAPTLCHSSEVHDTFHPLENLLIEHPTMSVYCQHNRNALDNINEELHEDGTNMNLQGPQHQNTNQNHELVLVRNRQRHQLAVEMQIPPSLVPPRASSHVNKPPRLTRRALKRHNTSRKHQGNRIPKCSFKAGRRRC